jgi:hypothetical protein
MFDFPEQNTEVVKTDKNRASEKRKGKMNSRRFGFTVLAILFFTIVPNVQVIYVFIFCFLFVSLSLSLLLFWET